MTKPLVTVAVPVYNTVRDLPQCIDSLLTQTHTDFELLLLDDGSTDGSVALCRNYALRDPRIRFVPLRHGGVSATRNKALELARGEYIVFVDADDWVEEEFLARLLAAPRPGPDSVVIQGTVVDQVGGPSHPLRSYPDLTIYKGKNREAFVRHELLSNGYVASKLFSMQLIREHRLRFCEELALMEDHLFFLSYMRHARTVILRSGMPYHYMRRGYETLITRRQAPEDLTRLGVMLLQHLEPAVAQWEVTDPEYLLKLHQTFGITQLITALSMADRTSFGSVYAATARQREIIEACYDPARLHHPIVGPKLLRLILRLPARLYGIPYAAIRLRHRIRSAKGRPVNY